MYRDLHGTAPVLPRNSVVIVLFLLSLSKFSCRYVHESTAGGSPLDSPHLQQQGGAGTPATMTPQHMPTPVPGGHVNMAGMPGMGMDAASDVHSQASGMPPHHPSSIISGEIPRSFPPQFSPHNSGPFPQAPFYPSIPQPTPIPSPFAHAAFAPGAIVPAPAGPLFTSHPPTAAATAAGSALANPFDMQRSMSPFSIGGGNQQSAVAAAAALGLSRPGTPLNVVAARAWPPQLVSRTPPPQALPYHAHAAAAAAAAAASLSLASQAAAIAPIHPMQQPAFPNMADLGAALPHIPQQQQQAAAVPPVSAAPVAANSANVAMPTAQQPVAAGGPQQ